MTAIIYARVSTSTQAERELSIPAQLRLTEQWAHEHGLQVHRTYKDVASGTSFRNRPGLLAAIKEAAANPEVDTFLVHRIDRLSRNTVNYLTIKGKLRQHGVRVVSVVEAFDSNPMGEFLEHIMAAQAEFYSANLSMEVRKGLEERLLRGKWNGPAPIGYTNRDGRLCLDQARAPHLHYAFTRWAVGDISSSRLASELEERGLVGSNGKVLRANALCRILKSPFYAGLMRVKGQLYKGVHPPLISKSLHERCVAVFSQKNQGRRRTRRHLVFVLAGKVRCPQCAAVLVGERHVKPSGHEYRYYRCHAKDCSFTTRAKELDAAVLKRLLSLPLAAMTVRIRQQEAAVRTSRSDPHARRVRELRSQRRRLEQEVDDLRRAYLMRRVAKDAYRLQLDELKHSIRVIEWALSPFARQHGDEDLGGVVEKLGPWLCSEDHVSRRRGVDSLVELVCLHIDGRLEVQLRPAWRELLDAVRTSTHPTTREHHETENSAT